MKVGDLIKFTLNQYEQYLGIIVCEPWVTLDCGQEVANIYFCNHGVMHVLLDKCEVLNESR